MKTLQYIDIKHYLVSISGLPQWLRMLVPANYLRVLLSCLGLALACTVAQAQKAPPNDWWVHIANDRVSQVERLLKAGVDPNAFGPQGLPATMFAVTENAWNVYELLLAQPSTDILVENTSQESLLMYMALVGDVQRVEDLIRRGAQVNRLGWTPLMYAASTGRTDTVKLLLKHGAIVNSPGPQGENALMMAAVGDHDAVVRQLLAAGADPSIRDLEGRSAADWARMKNHTALGQDLDTVAQKVLARREAQRNPALAPTPAEETPAKSIEPAESTKSGGAQRYFDLERFESGEEPLP